MILQKASSQHIFKLLWCSCRSLEEHFDGSTSQFSSDSYRALINSPETKIRQGRKINNVKESELVQRTGYCSTVLLVLNVR